MVLTYDEIVFIQKDTRFIYARKVVDYWAQKDKSARARITVGGNLFEYHGKLTTCTADLSTSEIM